MNYILQLVNINPVINMLPRIFMIIEIRLSPPKMVDVKMRHSGILRYRSPDDISLRSGFLCLQSSQVPTKAPGPTANILISLINH